MDDSVCIHMEKENCLKSRKCVNQGIINVLYSKNELSLGGDFCGCCLPVK